MNARDTNGPIHVAITRRVKPGCERAFEEALSVFAQRSLAEPGMRGVYCLYPVPGSTTNEYGILRSFANQSDRERFYQTELYQQWLAAIEPWVEAEPQYRELHGLEAWFRDAPPSNPARWKMALLTWVAVWPVSIVVPAFMTPLLGTVLPQILFAGVVAGGIVVVLTWAAMPLLVKLMKGWLFQRGLP